MKGLIIFWLQVAVTDSVYYIQIAGAQLIEEADGFMPATIWIQFERDPLPDKDMVTDAGGEPIISRGILIRLLGPEIPVK